MPRNPKIIEERKQRRAAISATSAQCHGLHTAWASRDTKIKELELENKKLKAKLKELKGSGGAVSTSTAGARS